MIAKHYCDYCECEKEESECYCDSNGDWRCRECNDMIDHDVDVCEVCHKKLYSNDSTYVCEECLRKVANPEDVMKFIEAERDAGDDRVEEYTDSLINHFYSKSKIREILLEQIKRDYTAEVKAQNMFSRKSFNHTVEDTIVDFYKDEQDVLMDDEAVMLNQMIENKEYV